MSEERLLGDAYGIASPWKVTSTTSSAVEGTAEVRVELTGKPECPKCGRQCIRHDKRPRKWRAKDLGGLRAHVVTDLPRASCPEHGVLFVTVPWAEPGISYTKRFETYVIDLLKRLPRTDVMDLTGLSWTAVDNMMKRAVVRGKARRDEPTPRRICVDEVSSRKRHKYMTVVTDERTGHVLYVGIGRTTESLAEFYRHLTPEQLAGIECVSMDMWPAYIKATKDSIPDADRKISFDRFHVAQILGKAVNRVRRAENRALVREGDDTMVGTRFFWLSNLSSLSWRQQRDFADVRRSAVQTAKAWAMKETARGLWAYDSRGWAAKAWEKLVDWMAGSELAPMRAAAETLRRHLWGIINAIVLKASNGLAESINSRIKTLKTRACGFRNEERFRDAILFHLGGLDLYPDGIEA